MAIKSFNKFCTFSKLVDLKKLHLKNVNPFENGQFLIYQIKEITERIGTHISHYAGYFEKRTLRGIY